MLREAQAAKVKPTPKRTPAPRGGLNQIAPELVREHRANQARAKAMPAQGTDSTISQRLNQMSPELAQEWAKMSGSKPPEVKTRSKEEPYIRPTAGNVPARQTPTPFKTYDELGNLKNPSTPRRAMSSPARLPISTDKYLASEYERLGITQNPYKPTPSKKKNNKKK